MVRSRRYSSARAGDWDTLETRSGSSNPKARERQGRFCKSSDLHPTPLASRGQVQRLRIWGDVRLGAGSVRERERLDTVDLGDLGAVP